MDKILGISEETGIFDPSKSDKNLIGSPISSPELVVTQAISPTEENKENLNAESEKVEPQKKNEPNEIETGKSVPPEPQNSVKSEKEVDKVVKTEEKLPDPVVSHSGPKLLNPPNNYLFF